MKDIFRKSHLFCLYATFVTIGISVSLSQGFLVLSFLFGLTHFLLSENRNRNWARHPLFLLSVSLFAWYFIVFGAHRFLDSPNSVPIKNAWNGELKDFFLFFGFLSVCFVSKEDLPKTYRALFWLLLVLVITGFIGGFTPVRLARLVSELYKESSTYKFTHPLGSILSVPIYISIGLMNTHLTFGGLMQFFSAFVTFYFLRTLADRKWKSVIYSGTLLLFYIVVFLLNQARSSMIGAGVTLGLAGIHLFFVRKELPKSFLAKGAGAFLALLVLVSSVLAFSPAGKKVIGPLFGKEKHTDSGRTFIWVSTFPLVQDHPWIGVGPGNYNASIDKTRTEQSEAYPELAYFYEVTQRGHAHNDYFHLATIFGLPGALIYLSLAGAILYFLFRSKQEFSRILFFYGLLGFFVSGLFQCYFQDDEVVILFWLLLGLFVRGESEISKGDTA